MPSETAPTATETPEWRGELDALRGSIDNIDAALIHLLAERFKCTQKVGRLKARFALPPADPAREAQPWPRGPISTPPSPRSSWPSSSRKSSATTKP